MAFEILYHPDVKNKDIPEINKKLRLRIRKAIEERLATEPEKYGKPLRKTLKKYWKLRVGDYRIVYEIDKKTVYVLGIIHRKKVYKDVLNRL
ncbi:MAG: type II toxin-antitoxin system RelE/ParE family toxin [Caldisericaceae bacterium]|nr:type II toxin-antitoxin system RelE/ParE family toxin [Caldisericaceae bacterium]